MYFLYSVLAAAVMVFLAPYYFVQGLRHGKYLHNLRERMGHLPPRLVRRQRPEPARRHLDPRRFGGRSPGSLPLAQALKQRYPDRRLVVTTTTDTGQRLARERMKFADDIFYFRSIGPAPFAAFSKPSIPR